MDTGFGEQMKRDVPFKDRGSPVFFIRDLSIPGCPRFVEGCAVETFEVFLEMLQYQKSITPFLFSLRIIYLNWIVLVEN